MTFTSLVIDDDALTRRLLRHCLTQAGYHVLEAEDGQDALNQLQTSSPDFVIMDVLMPGMNGFELVKHIRTMPETAQLPIIFLSSRADTAALKKGFEAGAQRYLFKPFSRVDLLAHIEEILPAHVKTQA